MVLDSAVGSGAGAGGIASTVVVVAMGGDTGSAAFIAECILTGSESGCSSIVIQLHLGGGPMEEKSEEGCVVMVVVSR